MTRFCAMLALCAALSPVVAADAPTYQGARWRASDVALQARSCVGEIGHAYPRRRPLWEGQCLAMAGIHARRAARQGVSLGRMVRAYSAPMRGAGSRPWVRHLADRPVAPLGWPEGPSWARHRPLYRYALEVVREGLRGERPDPCEAEAPLHYGGPMDGTPGEGWERVDCAPGPQWLWRRGGGES